MVMNKDCRYQLLKLCISDFCIFAVPATIVTDLADHEVLVDKSTSLLCSVVGNPKPAVAWYKNEMLLRGTDDADGVELRDNNRRLLFKHAKPIHAGEYTCEAVNVVTDLFWERTVTVRTSCHMTVLGTSSTFE